MKKWTKKQLEAEGYEIWNAEIKNVFLSMEDHACLVSYLSLDGHGPCCCYGGYLSLIHISEPTRRTPISYAVFCLKKKKKVYAANFFVR